MTKPDLKTVLTGALAGMTAALLALGAVYGSSLSFTLYSASALPILIAGLGWGNWAALSALVSAFIVSALALSPQYAALLTAVMLGPAAWISHLANLARPASEIGGPGHLMAWYPLSDILLQLCGLIAAGTILTGYMVGYGPGLVGDTVDLMMSAVRAGDPGFAADPEVVGHTKSLLLTLLPATQGAIWVLIVMLAYYVATRIVALSGRSIRPREDMPSALKMSQIALFVFLAGLAAAFVGGPVGWAGAAVAGTFGAGFLMAGFASVHVWTRGKSIRIPALILAYLSTLFGLGAFVMLVIGLADTRRTVALTPIKTDKPE